MIEKKLKSGRKVKIKDISIDKIDALKDIPEIVFYGDGGTKTIKNVNKARTAWIREGLGGGDFEDWKPNGKNVPDSVLKQLTDEEFQELHGHIQLAQTINPKKPSN